MTPLHVLSLTGNNNIEIYKLFKQYFCITCFDEFGRYPIHYLCYFFYDIDINIYKELMCHRIDVSIKDNYNMSCLDYLYQHKYSTLLKHKNIFNLLNHHKFQRYKNKLCKVYSPTKYCNNIVLVK
jgi:hypothetical protein